jgi:hypothetical protein
MDKVQKYNSSKVVAYLTKEFKEKQFQIKKFDVLELLVTNSFQNLVLTILDWMFYLNYLFLHFHATCNFHCLKTTTWLVALPVGKL